ncbi:hypothetical protein [Patulibacter sp. SYSU D01012]|uniref:hypothetical protein n=1 Tax=Patulibacter sp. SYSU D01012 TaxID=2817381 RepID=UPI001B3188D3|nr:hypothetical protein [Patulibacter sp. SYSU D01012]
MSRSTRDSVVRALGVVAVVLVLIGGWQSGGDGNADWVLWILLAVVCVVIAWAIAHGAPDERR